MTMLDSTVEAILKRVPQSAPAISAPGRTPLTYAALCAQQQVMVAALEGHAVGPDDRVAIVLPNGPLMASCFVAVAAIAAAAPLNPSYLETEFEYYLADLEARVLIAGNGTPAAAHAAAARLGIAVIELDEDPDGPAGGFTVAGRAAAAPRKVPRGADAIALVLHTSGTTSRPKIVPLSQANLCASATHIAGTLALTADDRCLNIMPLFHIHGLIGAVLASFAAGGEVCCTPGFNAMKFFSWLEETAPTWYTAVPTMHQTILERAARNPAIVANNRLRFIRSSSSSLPPPVMQELEQTFHCPVIESYGMTEAAHQMTSNPLPPAARKAGSVGLAAGPEVRLMDASGGFVANGGEGEIVIRGPNVTAGYAGNAAANATAFAADPDGGGAWFRTGDQGVFDSDGYLRISGRLKEIINRGGEKIAPREVDDVLMEHAAVAQVVTFARPHAKLGEDVAAAVVLNAGTSATEAELREFAATRLAGFKVPRTIVFLDEIPKGATGKLQRIGLAARLGLD